MNTGKEEVCYCDVCGISSDEKIVKFVKRAEMFLCSKHKKQIYAYGYITDPTSRTTHDRNEYIIHDNYAEIVLRDSKNNIMDYAIIDLDDVDRCKTQKWYTPQASPGHTKYVRAKNSKINTSLHRFVLGYDGDMDVDHINRNTMDNRKSNLRIVPRTVNNSNNGSKCIVKLKENTYRIFIQRYGKRFYRTVHGSIDDAMNVRDSILADIEARKDELMEEYDALRSCAQKGISLLPSGKWQATYCMNGSKIRSKRFDTMQEAIDARELMVQEYEGGVPCAV